jgi:hypothetical protein
MLGKSFKADILNRRPRARGDPYAAASLVARGQMAFATITLGGYGFLRSQGRHQFFGRSSTRPSPAKVSHLQKFIP